MPGDGMQVRLLLDSQDGDRDRAEDDLRYLREELAELGVAGIERESDAPAPKGVRGVGLDTAGVLLVALGSSGATLPMLVGLVRDWLLRRGSGTVRLKIGSDEIEVTRASGAVQERALNEFLRRHKV